MDGIDKDMQIYSQKLSILQLQLEAKLLDPLAFFPLDPMLNKSCNIERCGNKMNQIVTNMMLFQYLELKLSLLLRGTVS